MPETDTGGENEPFFEGTPLEKLFDKTPREDMDEYEDGTSGGVFRLPSLPNPFAKNE